MRLKYLDGPKGQSAKSISSAAPAELGEHGSGKATPSFPCPLIVEVFMNRLFLSRLSRILPVVLAVSLITGAGSAATSIKKKHRHWPTAPPQPIPRCVSTKWLPDPLNLRS